MTSAPMRWWPSRRCPIVANSPMRWDLATIWSSICIIDVRSVNQSGLLIIDRGSAYLPEMAGYRQGSEVPPEAAPPQHCWVPWLLLERAHSMGECVLFRQGSNPNCEIVVHAAYVTFMKSIILYVQNVCLRTLMRLLWSWWHTKQRWKTRGNSKYSPHVVLCVYCCMTLMFESGVQGLHKVFNVWKMLHFNGSVVCLGRCLNLNRLLEKCLIFNMIQFHLLNHSCEPEVF